MVTPATFRQLYKPFSDPHVYSDVILDFWIGIAGTFLDATRWGDALDYGTGLFVAHHLKIDMDNQAASAAGGTPGQVKGPVTSKTVGRVSLSYDVSRVTLEGAGFWNLSTYGIRFYQLSVMIGAGGVQSGASGAIENDQVIWGGQF